MNNDKVRELFSAYYEDSLDAGLRQTVEARFKADAVLAGDFAAFSETMKDLQALQTEAIEIPIFLRDRIATRVEEVSGRRSPLVGWQVWLRGFGLAGLAAVVVIGGFIATHRGANGGASMASILPTNVPFDADRLGFTYDGSTVTLSYHPSSAKTVLISSAVSGQPLKRFDLDGQTLASPLTNRQDGAALFAIQVVGESNRLVLAVPGLKRSEAKAGTGNVTDLAVAIAEHYHVPVLIQTSGDVTKPTSWDFSGTDPRKAASDALVSAGFSVDMRPSGLLVII